MKHLAGIFTTLICAGLLGQFAAQCLTNYEDSLSNTNPSSCYRINGENWPVDGRSWDVARSQCQSEGGDLAIITSTAELDYLTQRLNATDFLPVVVWHVGLEKIGKDWYWVDGSPVDLKIVQWDNVAAPAAYSNGALRTDGKFQKVLGISSDFYICERSKYTIANCDVAQGWNPTEDGTQCLKFYSTSSIDFWKARETCQKSSADLSVTNTEAINFAVSSKLTALQTSWIGLTTALNTLTINGYAQWQWVNKVNLGTYTKWENPASANILTSARNNACSSISNKGVWSVRSCNTTDANNKFVCQRAAGECPDGWTLYKDICYLFGYKKTWLEANQDCNSRGANLVVNSDDSVQEYINSVLPDFFKNGVNHIWIGYRQNGPNDPFYSVVSSISTKTNWSPGEPKNGNLPYGCGRIDTSGDGRWSSSTCADLKGYLCQSPKGRVVKGPITVFPNPLLYCEVGWAQWNQQCYQVMRETSNFDGGTKICEASGAKLAYIEQIEYQAFVTRLTESHKGNAYLIGLKKVAPGDYVWQQTNQQANSFRNFIDGANDRDDKKNCVFMHGGVTQDAGRWDFISCDQGLPIICSKKPSLIAPQPTPPPTNTGTPSTRCPSGWEEDGATDFCYFFMRYDTSYTNALHGCRSLGGELAYIHSIEAMRFIATRIKDRNSGWWIGLNRLGSELGYYSWTLGSEPIAFTSWAPGEPKLSSGDCVLVRPETGMWEFADCSKSYDFICQRVSDIVRPTRPPVVYTTPTGGSLSCGDDGWVQYNNNQFCYKFVKGQFSWQSGVDYCKSAADLGNLVSIGDSYEQLFVQLLAQEKALEAGVNFTTIWMGMTDKLDTAYPRMVQYYWNDNTNVRYTNWLPREPSSSDKECVSMNAALDGQWHDLDCSTDRVDGILCKAPPVVLSAPKTTTKPSGCPNNFKIAYEGKCYYINSVALLDWDKAKQACIALTGTLLVLSTRQEQNFISVALSDSSVASSAYWMGLYGSNDNWKWVDGTTPTFTNWDSSYTAPSTQTCVAITDASENIPGLWTTKECGVQLPYICQATRVGWTRTTQRVTSTNPRFCPTGWITRGSRCYLPVAEKLTLSEAIDFCETKHLSLLASFLSLNDQAEVARNMSRFGVQDAWIGFGKQDVEHGWQWMDGSPVLYEQWDSNEPDYSDDTKSCTFMSYDSSSINSGVWVSDSCTSTERNFICMRKTSDGTITTPKVPDTNGTELCNGTGWSVYGSYCYYPYQSSQPWTRGRDLCDGIKADLVSILSPEENIFVHQLVRGDLHLFTWIGLSEIGYKGFYWSDNSPYTYVNWDSGAHDIDGPCVAMSISSGKWSNQHCDSKFSFVCKKPIGGTVVRPTTPPPTAGGCPSDSVTYGKSSRCYRIVTNSKLTQSDAILECQRGIGRNRNLASFGDAAELNFVISKLRNTTKASQAAHIGLKDYSTITGQPSFRWLDNSLLYFTNWDINEPDVLPTTPPGSCVEMLLSGTSVGIWRVQKNCNYQQTFICSMPKSTSYVTPSEPNNCETNWIPYNEHCYFVDGATSATAVSWAAANDACERLDAELVSIHDAYEQAAVTWAVLSSVSTTPLNFWIGLNTNNAPDVWEWSDSWPVDFVRWLPTEPSESTSKRCAAGVIRGTYASEAGDWASVDCRNKNAYVCRKTKGKPNTDDSLYVDGTCPTGWLNGISKCYFLDSTARVMWSDAILKCRANNGTFGTVDTVSDNQILAYELNRQKVLYGSNAEDVWLGISSSGGDFYAADGSPVSYFNWAEGVQAVPGLSQAAFMEQTSFWYLADPTKKLGFVCKRSKDPRPTYPPIDVTRTSDQPDVFTKQPPVYAHTETFDSGVALIIGICVSFVVILGGVTVLLVYLKRKNMVPKTIDEIVSKSSAAARSSPSVYTSGPTSSGPSTSSGLVGFENVTFEPPKDQSASTVPKDVNSGNEFDDINQV